MQTPKYKFYIGKQYKDLQFISQKDYDASGNLIVAPSRNTYELIKVKPGQVIYLDTDVSYKEGSDSHSIKFFNANGAVINTIGISTYNGKFITIPEKVEYFAPVISLFDLENYDIFSTQKFVYILDTCKPHYSNISKKYAKESNQEFFRESIDGKINLYGDDFEFVYSSNVEDKNIFFITKQNAVSGEWDIYYKGEFNKTDCKLDNAKKKCELKTEPLDKYSGILDNYENTYNLIKLKPAIEQITMHKRPLVQLYILGSNKISCIHSGTYWEADVNEVVDDADKMIKKYYFSEQTKLLEIGLSNGVLYAGQNAGQNSKYESQSFTYIEYYGEVTKYTNPQGSPIVYYRYQLKDATTNEVLYEYDKKKDVGVDNIPEVGGLFVSVGSAGTITITDVFAYDIYTRLLCDVSEYEYSGDKVTTHDLPIDDFVSDNRNYKKCIGVRNAVNIYISTKAVDEPTRYGQNDFKKYFTNKIFPDSMGRGRLYPVNRSYWVNASIWLEYTTEYKTFETILRKPYTLKDAYPIASVIKVLLQEIAPSLKHDATEEYSKFLYGTAVNKDPFYIFLTQKTNILKGDYDQAAQKAEIKFSELMQMLANCFKCYWFIDNGKFRVEHISYFINGGTYTGGDIIQMDFTKLKDQYNKMPAAYFQNEVDFSKDDLASRFEFNWMDDSTELFGGVTIDVKSEYVKKDKTQEVNISSFSSDVDFMLYNPENFVEDGFALLCAEKKNNKYELPIGSMVLIDEDGDTYEATMQNIYASWPYLVRFYIYDMPAINVKCNVLEKLFVSKIKSCMNHSISFLAEEDLDVYKLIRTSIGDGRIDSIDIDLNTRMTKVKLLYPPK